MRRLVLLASVAGLAACAGPRPPAPTAATQAPPAQWREAALTPASVDPRWWTAFGDPALAAVVEQALSNNPDLGLAAARVEEARAQFDLAQGMRGPNLVIAGGGADQRALNAFGQPVEQHAGQAQFSAAYDLDLFGRLKASSAAARSSLLATQAAQDSVRLAIASSAASGYVTLLALDARLEVLQKTVAAREGALKLIRRRVEAGYGAQLELKQASAEYQSALQLIPAVELARRRQEDGLRLLLGENPGTIARGAGLYSLAVPWISPGQPAALLRRRPDIWQAEQQLAASDHGLDAARAAFMPNVQLNGSWGYVASDLIDDPVHVFSIGGSILAPIFDSGRLKAQQGQAAARRDQAAFAYRKTVLNAFREVEDGLASVQRSGEQEIAATAQRDALAQALTLAESRYRAGYSPYLEQLDAQRGLLAADLNLVQLHADRLTAAIGLYQALGGGWTGADKLASR
ncbi:efflux transporter outer membrane subunit [Caulobacter segnis]|uniref:efflux transporter outer membrane subunit n=1 Tax=Caulobacter segnis TaxID=88688 RepID=UPI001CBD2999|nr:efflux transporter outer membrane subunit [Caulobacter segnis]UAL10183.1 efflux transporter outer membrane subunit [Caulobacter segnis]